MISRNRKQMRLQFNVPADLQISRKADEPVLTQEAREAIEGYISSARERLMSELAQASTRSIESTPVQPDDVELAIRRISALDGKNYCRQLLRRSLGWIAPGTVAAVAACTLGFTLYYSDNSQKDALASGLGIALAVTASVAANILFDTLHSYFERRRTRGQSNTSDFLRRFSQLEFALRNYTSSIAGEEVSRGQLSAIFDAIQRAAVWTASDTQNFRGLLRLRNAIVHEELTKIDESTFREAMHQVNHLLELLPRTKVSRKSARSPAQMRWLEI